jgi:hypothetical protein
VHKLGFEDGRSALPEVSHTTSSASLTRPARRSSVGAARCGGRSWTTWCPWSWGRARGPGIQPQRRKDRD